MAGYLAFVEEIKQVYPDMMCRQDKNSVTLGPANAQSYYHTYICKDYIHFVTDENVQDTIQQICSITNCSNYIIGITKVTLYGDYLEHNGLKIVFCDKTNMNIYGVYNEIACVGRIINDKVLVFEKSYTNQVDEIKQFVEDYKKSKKSKKSEQPYKPVFLD